MKKEYVNWVLRIGVAGEFIGHGVFALQGKKQWIGWMQQLTGVDTTMATQLIFLVGLLDIAIALVVLIKPLRPVLLWAAIWGFWTALLRPLVGEPIWDFIERWANWAAPLALFLMTGRDREIKR
ncbi:MAG: hypothetical protein US86_C0002G0101 [Candidatus Daviesbacteria bacterium GW2011_GWA2_38_24]|uniref:DoxX family protein n=1 Tax=Candidatus Daviesbacteria bacterium GW2011_GWA2_38_24 TaxID=1618422 RepID=A0A0G0LZY8_9BACT|nr:MAG: hypothetical protein US86_C0002G0101 [Candidatus Daviesbacteria bacterium GW2011_GWA2_38_24]KKQ80744.1 MAG: hypothetical protein UT01_C0006G0005 [Candidatus Daviesbacteria bacterium GW2011_GWA1_38_7]OGE22944.1 MAG: hypothetical protein A2688_03820 [Candidatus Daviesbacteria bacterium RIFCSPHIGHO2_01_FULL_38_8]